MRPLIKNLIESELESELDHHLTQDIITNRRNWQSKKTIKSINDNFELSTPKDRSGTFEPKIVKKHQTRSSDSIE